jgi:hypothetical protein
LLRLILAIKLNCDIGEVKFFGNTGTSNDVDYCQTLFIGGHVSILLPGVYKLTALAESILSQVKTVH